VQGAWTCQMLPSTPEDQPQAGPKPCLLLIGGEPLQAERSSHNRGCPSGDGKRGDTSTIFSSATVNQIHCPYL